MTDTRNRYWPIIYVRGYAMTRGEIDDTTADPFCGFNLGSTVMRARPDKKEPPKKFVFESPVVRLRSDFDYSDVYEDGVDIVDPDWKGGIAVRSIIVYRYYDEASSLLGVSKTPEIETFAKGLDTVIKNVRDRVCELPANNVTPEEFRCYLVAHSMGGLVCRAFLQNPDLGSDEARKCVDKFFTYATPHNGIDVGGVNVPEWLNLHDISNFSRERMAEYLRLKPLLKKTGRVDWLPEERFPSKCVFCMVATNRSDYEAAAGLSRTFTGHGGDGLVRIANASVWGVDASGKFSAPSATAYAYRSHSGPYGIVNSEESYQNLVRFLFGDVRVDIWVDIEEVRVPEELEEDDEEGKLDALYQIEVLASPRGKRWYLTRRTAEEDSVAARRHADLRDPKKKDAASQVYVSTIFLSSIYKVVPERPTLAYALSLGIRVPDYEVDKRFQPNRHFEGQYLFRDVLVLELTPPAGEGGDWNVHYDWESDDVAQASKPVPKKDLEVADGQVAVRIRFESSDATPPRSPGVSGQLRFVIARWNR